MPAKSQQPKVARAATSVLQYNAIRACLSDLRETVEKVGSDSERAVLLAKLANLDDCIFDDDEWAAHPAGEQVLKVAVLGRPQGGQSQLLQRFLCGHVESGDSSGIRRKNPLESLTGVKQTVVTIGKKHKTSVPFRGQNVTMLIRTEVGEPGPHVLGWADAFVITFDGADQASLQEVAGIHAKTLRYRRREDLPCVVVGVAGLEAAGTQAGGGTVEHAELEFWRRCPGVDYFDSNPKTGLGVTQLFHDLIHKVVDSLFQRQQQERADATPGRKKREPRRAGDEPAAGAAGSAEPAVLKSTLRKHHAHGGHAQRFVVLVKGVVKYFSHASEYLDGKPGKSIPLTGVTVKLPLLPRRPSGAVTGSPGAPGTPGKGGGSGTPGKGPGTPRRGGSAKGGGPDATFTIVSLTGEQWKFETADMAEAKAWHDAIQREIEALIRGMRSEGAKNNDDMRMTKKYTALTPDQIARVRAVPGNDKCADCKHGSPEWASLNFGIVCCLDCSGIHRELGVHISRVRSLDLDDWREDHLQIMDAVGNRAANTVLEANVPVAARPGLAATREARAVFIRAKYEARAFLAPAARPGAALAAALGGPGPILNHDAYRALAACSPAQLNSPLPTAPGGGTALHTAAAAGSQLWVQLLIWAGADTNQLNQEGKTALHYAKASASTGHVDCAELLVAAGCTSAGPGSSPRKRLNTTLPARRSTPTSSPGAGAGAGAGAGPAGDSPDIRTRSGTVWAKPAPSPAGAAGPAEPVSVPALVRSAPAAAALTAEAASDADSLGLGSDPDSPAPVRRKLPQSPLEVQLKQVLRAEKVKLWDPPYTALDCSSTITPEVYRSFATKVGSSAAEVGPVLERLRAKAVARKSRKGRSPRASPAASPLAPRRKVPSALGPGRTSQHAGAGVAPAAAPAAVAVAATPTKQPSRSKLRALAGGDEPEAPASPTQYELGRKSLLGQAAADSAV